MVRILHKDDDFPTNPGNPIHIIYKPEVAKDGSITLVESGKENTDDLIQSYAESCDLALLVAKFAQGDLTALNQARGVYGDFTQMPKTYAEVLQMQIDAADAFQKLPPEIRNKFDNDVNKFLATAGEEDWYEKLNPENTPLENNVPKVSNEVASNTETA